MISKPADWELCVLNYDSEDEFGLAMVDANGDDYVEEIWPALGEDNA